MLELINESDDDILAVRAGGVLTKDDYQDVLVPQLETALQNTNRIRVLVHMDETFQGWDARAAWCNTRLDVRHRRNFDKVAIVGAPTWEQWCIRLANVLITGKIRTFKADQLNDAWTWLHG